VPEAFVNADLSTNKLKNANFNLDGFAGCKPIKGQQITLYNSAINHSITGPRLCK
jgi:hypothetical protein